MCEKVELTQCQVDAIDGLLEKGSRDEIIDTHFNINSWQNPVNKPLNNLKASQLAKALYNGYEVKRPKFTVNDWVINTQLGGAKAFKVIGVEYNQFTGRHYAQHYVNGDITTTEFSHLRYATEQEIWWSQYNRGVWELIIGDVLINKNDSSGCGRIVDKIDRVLGVRFLGNYGYTNMKSIKRDYKVLCFADNRSDI